MTRRAPVIGQTRHHRSPHAGARQDTTDVPATSAAAPAAVSSVGEAAPHILRNHWCRHCEADTVAASGALCPGCTDTIHRNHDRTPA